LVQGFKRTHFAANTAKSIDLHHGGPAVFALPLRKKLSIKTFFCNFAGGKLAGKTENEMVPRTWGSFGVLPSRVIYHAQVLFGLGEVQSRWNAIGGKPPAGTRSKTSFIKVLRTSCMRFFPRWSRGPTSFGGTATDDGGKCKTSSPARGRSKNDTMSGQSTPVSFAICAAEKRTGEVSFP